MVEVNFISNNTHALLKEGHNCTFVSSLPDGNLTMCYFSTKIKLRYHREVEISMKLKAIRVKKPAYFYCFLSKT